MWVNDNSKVLDKSKERDAKHLKGGTFTLILCSYFTFFRSLDLQSTVTQNIHVAKIQLEKEVGKRQY